MSVAGLCAKLAACFEVALYMAWTAVLDGCLAALACWYAVADVPLLLSEDGMAAVNTRQGKPACD